MNNFLKINREDNVIVALTDIHEGETVNGILMAEDVGHGHKIACRDITEGEDIIKYGAPIGKATCAIQRGSLVHTHNVKTKLDDINDYTYQPRFEQIKSAPEEPELQVYYRKNGDIGIRNELWIVPTVGCANSIAYKIAETFKNSQPADEIDGVFVFGHNFGCSQMGDDLENTRISLQGIAKHPNAGGVLVLGLGCENNQLDTFMDTLGDYNPERIRFLESQAVEDEIEEGVLILKQLYDLMKKDKREKGRLSQLRIGLKCGGSDGFSGITANPLLGEFSDYINNHGGTTVLTEVPEMFGAETILMNRAQNEEVFNKIAGMINDYKTYYKNHGQVIYENPSPGNKKGGITTLEEKSMGCIRKAGLSKIMDVIRVGDTLKVKGLNLLSAPGNDLVATTSLGIAGCHMVLFTTGRGTPFGGFIPTVKISSNSELAERKKHWIDFDAGKLCGESTMSALTEQFIKYVIQVVNGKKTNNEKNGAREIALFKSGVTL